MANSSVIDKPMIQEPFIFSSIRHYFPAIIYCRNNGTYCGHYWDYGRDIDNYTIADVHNSRFTTHLVDCTYNLSGNYGPTPRYIFYALVLLSIFGRKRAWVVNVALVSVMLYSATASLHAILLASFSALRFADTFSAMKSNYEVVLAGGYSSTGLLEPGGRSDDYSWPRWLPILPMTYDPDPDAIIGIIGVTYLCLIPAQLRSRTIRTLDKNRRYLIQVWVLLVTIGLAAAFSARIFMAIWYTTQVRFCARLETISAQRFEPLPRFSQGRTQGLAEWDRIDAYRWNRTVNAWFPPARYDYFSYGYYSGPPPNSTCLYPCADFRWPMRDPEDVYIQALRLEDSSSVADSDSFISLSNSLIFLAAGWYLLSLIIYIILFLRSTRGRRAPDGTDTEAAHVGIRTSFSDLKAAWRLTVPLIWKLWKLLAVGCMLVISAFAWVTTLIGLILLGTSEYVLWHSNPTLLAESFSHVGQWSILASTSLLFGGVLLTVGYRSLTVAELPS